MKYKNGLPQRRAIPPGEIAATVAFLATKDASYITGADGGLTQI